MTYFVIESDGYNALWFAKSLKILNAFLRKKGIEYYNIEQVDWDYVKNYAGYDREEVNSRIRKEYAKYKGLAAELDATYG